MAQVVAVVVKPLKTTYDGQIFHLNGSKEMEIQRQGIIVWFQHRKNIKQIRKFGNLIYVSSKMRYAVLYADQLEIDSIVTDLEKLPFVLKVDLSQKPFMKTDFENALPDKAKIYDYKMGL